MSVIWQQSVGIGLSCSIFDDLAYALLKLHKFWATRLFSFRQKRASQGPTVQDMKKDKDIRKKVEKLSIWKAGYLW